TCHLPANRTLVVANGIPDLSEDLMTRQPPPDGPLRVIGIGSIYQRKGYADLIRAVADLGGIDMQCMLVGRLWELPPDVADLAGAQPDRFKFYGEVPNDAALELLASAHIYALPSGDESMPLTNLEAARLGKALVLSDLRVYQDIWRHGYNCLMHP